MFTTWLTRKNTIKFVSNIINREPICKEFLYNLFVSDKINKRDKAYFDDVFESKSNEFGDRSLVTYYLWDIQ